MSPAGLFFKRLLRTRLALVKVDPQMIMQQKQQQQHDHVTVSLFASSVVQKTAPRAPWYNAQAL